MKSLARGLRLLDRMMTGEELAVPELVNEGTNGSEPTVRRTLNTLAEHIAGVDVYSGRPPRWKYWAEPSGKDTLGWTVMTLQLAQILLAFIRDSRLETELRRLLKARLVRLPPGDRVRPDLDRIFFVKSRVVMPTEELGSYVDTLVRAILDGVRLRVVYRRFHDAESTDDIEPWSLLFGDEGLYCYAHCASSTESDRGGCGQLYNLARISSMETLDDTTFCYPTRAEYDPHKLFQHNLSIFLPPREQCDPASVKLAFAKHWGPYLTKHRWHETQSPPEEMEDGRFLVRFRLHSTLDVIRWIRGFGPEVEVLDPVELRTEVGRWVSVESEEKGGDT